ncbi:hypothetical protein C3Y89_24225 [Rhizobium sp. UPM1132]|nr:hypothetical protein [Rhizobium ruizarguesonis]
MTVTKPSRLLFLSRRVRSASKTGARSRGAFDVGRDFHNPASIAARYSVVEQAVQCLLHNRGGGERDGKTAEQLR